MNKKIREKKKGERRMRRRGRRERRRRNSYCKYICIKHWCT
jgi:hypothetical protein